MIDWHDGSRDFPTRWYWKDGHLTNDRDGDRSFPYFHFVCWKRNEWSDLPEQDAKVVQALASESSWVIDATGFHRGEL